MGSGRWGVGSGGWGEKCDIRWSPRHVHMCTHRSHRPPSMYDLLVTCTCTTYYLHVRLTTYMYDLLLTCIRLTTYRSAHVHSLTGAVARHDEHLPAATTSYSLLPTSYLLPPTGAVARHDEHLAAALA